MRYLMKQKLFSWGDNFIVRDADGKDAFVVDGKAFSIGNQLSLQDMQGKELASICEEVLSWGPTYRIFRDGQLYATVKKELFSFFSCRFDVEEQGQHDIEAEGDFSNHRYVFLRNQEQVAEVSMEWFSLADTYGVDVNHQEDTVLILASTVVIDLACHRSSQ